MYNMILPYAVLISLILFAVFLMAISRLLTQSRTSVMTGEVLANLSTDQYRPMERLLDESDFRFLAEQPGLDPKVAKRLRRERRAIFRSYLRRLCRDYRAICKALKLRLAESEVDRPDLTYFLLRQYFTFARALALVEIRLVLHGLGFEMVDVRGLITSFDTMLSTFQSSMTSAPALSAA